MNWQAMEPLAAWAFRIAINALGVFLMTHGAIKDGAGMETFLGMATSAGATFWSWWVTTGHIQAAKFLQNVTQTATTAAAVEVAKHMQYTPAVATAATDAKATVAAAIEKAADPVLPRGVPLILLAVVAGMLLFPGAAMAQVKSLSQIQQDIDAANARLAAINKQISTAAGNAKQQVTAATTPTDPTAPLTCDFKMLTHMTPDNLVPTIKGCFAKGDAKIIDDFTKALASAKAFKGGLGDGDGINCLTPGLAIVQAGAITAEVPEVPAVLNADGSVKTPAVPKVEAEEPGLVTLYQKYREFTLAGGLTACQTWFNGPINATASAGIAGVGSAVAGAAILAPK
jgi:hypothetical protein